MKCVWFYTNWLFWHIFKTAPPFCYWLETQMAPPQTLRLVGLTEMLIVPQCDQPTNGLVASAYQTRTWENIPHKSTLIYSCQFWPKIFVLKREAHVCQPSTFNNTWLSLVRLTVTSSWCRCDVGVCEVTSGRWRLLPLWMCVEAVVSSAHLQTEQTLEAALTTPLNEGRPDHPCWSFCWVYSSKTY